MASTLFENVGNPAAIVGAAVVAARGTQKPSENPLQESTWDMAYHFPAPPQVEFDPWFKAKGLVEGRDYQWVSPSELGVTKKVAQNEDFQLRLRVWSGLPVGI